MEQITAWTARPPCCHIVPHWDLLADAKCSVYAALFDHQLFFYLKIFTY